MPVGTRDLVQLILGELLARRVGKRKCGALSHIVGNRSIDEFVNASYADGLDHGLDFCRGRPYVTPGKS